MSLKGTTWVQQIIGHVSYITNGPIDTIPAPLPCTNFSSHTTSGYLTANDGGGGLGVEGHRTIISQKANTRGYSWPQHHRPPTADNMGLFHDRRKVLRVIYYIIS